MITSWLDVAGAVVLLVVGFYHLQRGEQRRRLSARWYGDVGALITALLGGMLVAMGLLLVLYSAAFAFLSG